jgi:hypothetical protein
MELRLLKHFIAVAEELHFARAASRLHLTQPALSKQIQQLEEALGFPLFYRTKQRVELLVRCRSRSPGRSAPTLATGGERGTICPAHPQRAKWPFSDRLPLIGYV